MKRPYYTRRLFMRIGLALCVLLAAGWVTASVCRAMYGGTRFHVFLRHGYSEFYTHGPTKPSGLRIDMKPFGYWRHWPSYKRSSNYITMPFWILFAPTLLMTIWMWRTSRIFPGKCWKCRYDLTGNESGVCPECGTTFDQLAPKP